MRFLSILTTAALVVTALAKGKERITFDSSGTQIVGYHWKAKHQRHPHQAGSLRPCIVMGHGLAALQSSKLQPYAERFAKEGYHAITFDYRYWGESGGEPRNIVDILGSQQDDFRAAVAAAKKLVGVDPNRIVIWGTSLSGGTVLQMGAVFYNESDSGVVGVISQVPHTNGVATSLLPPQNTIPNLVQLSLDDRKRINTTEEPIYIPVANYTGQFGLLTQAGALEGYEYIQPDPPGPEYNNIAARFVLELPSFNPDATAANSSLPTFIAIGTNDNVVAPDAAIKLAARMPNATTYQYQGAGHFDVYPGKSFYKVNIDNQVAFLKKSIPIQKGH